MKKVSKNAATNKTTAHDQGNADNVIIDRNQPNKKKNLKNSINNLIKEFKNKKVKSNKEQEKRATGNLSLLRRHHNHQKYPLGQFTARL